jgi:hypothetical protein
MAYDAYGLHHAADESLTVWNMTTSPSAWRAVTMRSQIDQQCSHSHPPWYCLTLPIAAVTERLVLRLLPLLCLLCVQCSNQL